MNSIIMLLNFLMTAFESFTVAVNVNRVVNEKLSKMKLIIYITIIILFPYLFTVVLKFKYGVLIGMIFVLVTTYIFNKNDLIVSFFALFVTYAFIMCSNILGILFCILKKGKVDVEASQIVKTSDFILMAFVEISFLTFLILKKHMLVKIYKKYIENKKGLSTIIVSFNLLISLSFMMIINLISDMKQYEKIIISLLLLALVGITIFYNAVLNVKAQWESKVNSEVMKKNNDLRKIKHDYATQLSMLYALYSMKKIDKLGEMLKQLIYQDSSICATVEDVMECKNAVILSAVRLAKESEIHVFVDDKCNLSQLNIKESELSVIILNIVNNSIEVLKGIKDGIISIQTLEAGDYLEIYIKNNGPKIPKENLEKIFEKGFTSKKKSKEDHGFGLFTVNEIVKKNSGKIMVSSNDSETIFNIEFKIH